MQQPLKCDWIKARAYYEAGHSQYEVAAKFGVSRPAVAKHIAKEGWSQELNKAIHNAMELKIARVQAGSNPSLIASSIEEEAERRAAVIHEHREEWRVIRDMKDAAIRKSKEDLREGFEQQKMTKITAETTMLKQMGERKAWGIDGPPAADSKQADVRQLTDAEIDRLLLKYESQLEQSDQTIQ